MDLHWKSLPFQKESTLCFECEDSRNANVGNVMSENIVGKAWIRTNHFTLVNRINGFEQKHADPSASPTASAAAN